jgi:N6-L-threonylcarbamoyladenine synthase
MTTPFFNYICTAMEKEKIILGIESSCDDTSAAVIRGEYLLANVMASQKVHEQYGGVIPELASRAHQMNIVPVVSEAIRQAGVSKEDIDAVAFTRGPGLLGSLLVGTSFAKGFSMAMDKPLVEVNHLQGHVLSHFIKVEGKENRHPDFPFLCLLVSGGHTQILKVNDYLDFEILGHTIDDAVGEAFDKCAKLMGLGYPGGPVVDKLAHLGNPEAFKFAKPHIEGLDYSFSGIKTSLLYFLRDAIKTDPDFVEHHKEDLCASFQKELIDILMDKFIKAVNMTGIRQIAIGGGVSANSGLRERITAEGIKRGWTTFLPEFRFTTDNAAMIAIVGLYKFQRGMTCNLDIAPISRALDYSLKSI